MTYAFLITSLVIPSTFLPIGPDCSLAVKAPYILEVTPIYSDIKITTHVFALYLTVSSNSQLYFLVEFMQKWADTFEHLSVRSNEGLTRWLPPGLEFLRGLGFQTLFNPKKWTQKKWSLIQQTCITLGHVSYLLQAQIFSPRNYVHTVDDYTEINGGSKLEVQNFESQTDPLDYQIVLP